MAQATRRRRIASWLRNVPGLALGLAGVPLALPGPAAAQTVATGQAMADAAQGWQFNITGYLWMSGIDMGVTGPNGRTVSQNYGFLDIMNHLHGMPFMGAAEVRYDRFGILADLIHLPVGGHFQTDNVLFRGGGVNLNTTIGTVIGLYRLVLDNAGTLDVGGGIRAYGLSATTSLRSGLLPGRSVSSWAATTDPVISMRGHVNIGNGFGVDAYGDVGGFGVGTKLSWQLIGAVDYQVNQSINLKLGYRYLQADLEKKEATIKIGGPFLAMSYRF
jgi:hypothetical protein